MESENAGKAGDGTVRKTFCRLCEVNCGLEVIVSASGELRSVRPDKSHPVTAGFACHKGLLARDVHHDPDRLMTPLRHGEQGFAPAGWDEAASSIAARLREIIDRDGPGAVGVYIGNPSAFNALGTMSVGMFAAALGIEHSFTAGTQDCTNKFAIGEILYGSMQTQPVADLDGCDFLLLMGTNPRVSKMSFLSTPDPVGALRAVRDRGARTVFVNPLAISDLADVGETLQIRPDTDAFLLAAMLHEIEQNPALGFDPEATTGVTHLDRLRGFVRRYSPDRVADVVGIGAGAIRELAAAFAVAPRAAVHVSTGVNMGRQGALAYWLSQMLSLVTGNLGLPGGNVFAARGLDAMQLPEEMSATRSTKWGEYRLAGGSTPGALLADMILDDEAPIRAMFVFAGNPLLSIAGGERLERAFASLDLLVSLDFYRNATAELADWVLPSADWFEREDLNFFVQGVQRRPYLQWTDAVVEPRGERRPDWWILSRILQEMALPSLLDVPDGDVMSAIWDGRLAETGHSVGALRNAEGGVVVLPEADAESLLGPLRESPFDCCPDALVGSLERAEVVFRSLESESPQLLKLITRRTNYMMNSALQNLKALKTAKGSVSNPLYMNPADARDRGLQDGQMVIVRNAHGELRAQLRLDGDLRPGVVAMSHGFGNQATPGMPVAQSHPGVNVNVLSPSGSGTFDPVSAMSQMTGIGVEVAPG